MKTEEQIKGKATYFPPIVTSIILDKEISLAMESELPPGGPYETNAPEYVKQDPFKNQLG
jgi:hypothetical protein